MTIHGTPKPAYRVFELLHGAGNTRLAVDGACPCASESRSSPIGTICPCTAPTPAGPAAGAGVGTNATVLPRCIDARNSTASGMLATSNGTALRLFLYNHPLFSGTAGSNCTVTVALGSGATAARANFTHDSTAGNAGHPSVDLGAATLTRIDDAHSNPKGAYVMMGSPAYPSESQLAELEAASALRPAPLSADATAVVSAGSFTLTVPANGLAVIDVPFK